MKKQFVKILSLCALGATTVFVSCKDKNDDEKPEVKIAKRVYILNEGSWGGNNSTLDVYYPDGENDYQSKIFAAANGQGLGDTGQDLLAYGNRLYVSVWGSNYIAKLDQKGKIIEKHEFTAEEGQPRYLAAKDGFIYVSTYGGKVIKFDTAAIVSPKVSVEVGQNPEQICIKGDVLYAAIAGTYGAYQNKIAVVDLTNFTFKENIEVREDPTNIITAGDKLYVIHYDTATWNQNILEVDPVTKKYTVFCDGSKMATDGEYLYSYSKVSMGNNEYAVGFDKTDLKTKAKSGFLVITDAPELPQATAVYLFEIDPDNGDFYLGTTDYVTNGVIYRFGKDGKLIAKFETSGINPNSAVFVK